MNKLLGDFQKFSWGGSLQVRTRRQRPTCKRFRVCDDGSRQKPALRGRALVTAQWAQGLSIRDECVDLCSQVCLVTMRIVR